MYTDVMSWQLFFFIQALNIGLVHVIILAAENAAFYCSFYSRLKLNQSSLNKRHNAEPLHYTSVIEQSANAQSMTVMFQHTMQLFYSCL